MTGKKPEKMLCPIRNMLPCKSNCAWAMTASAGEAEGKVGCAVAVLASVTANGFCQGKPMTMWFGEVCE